MHTLTTHNHFSRRGGPKKTRAAAVAVTTTAVATAARFRHNDDVQASRTRQTRVDPRQPFRRSEDRRPRPRRPRRHARDAAGLLLMLFGLHVRERDVSVRLRASTPAYITQFATNDGKFLESRFTAELTHTHTHADMRKQTHAQGF